MLRMFDFHMDIQMSFLGRVIVTYITLKWFISDVNSNVCSHSARIMCVILTKQTHVIITTA